MTEKKKTEGNERLQKNLEFELYLFIYLFIK